MRFTLPGLVGAWILAAFCVQLASGGGKLGAGDLFRISTEHTWNIASCHHGGGQPLWLYGLDST